MARGRHSVEAQTHPRLALVCVLFWLLHTLWCIARCCGASIDIHSVANNSGTSTQIEMRGQDGVQINGTENVSITSHYFLVDLGTQITTNAVVAEPAATLTLSGGAGLALVIIANGNTLRTDVIESTNNNTTVTISGRGTGGVQVADLLQADSIISTGNIAGASITSPLATLTIVNASSVNATNVSATNGLFGGVFSQTVNTTLTISGQGTGGVSIPVGDFLTFDGAQGSSLFVTTLTAPTGTIATLTTTNLNATNINASQANLTTTNVTQLNATLKVSATNLDGVQANITTVNVTQLNAQGPTGKVSATLIDGLLGNLSTVNVTVLNAQGATGKVSATNVDALLGNLTTANVTTLNAQGATGRVSATATQAQVANLTTTNVTVLNAIGPTGKVSTTLIDANTANLTTANVTVLNAIGPTGKVSATIVDGLIGNLTTVNVTQLNAQGPTGKVSATLIDVLTLNGTTANVTTLNAIGSTGKVSATLIQAQLTNETTVNVTTLNATNKVSATNLDGLQANITTVNVTALNAMGPSGKVSATALQGVASFITTANSTTSNADTFQAETANNTTTIQGRGTNRVVQIPSGHFLRLAGQAGDPSQLQPGGFGYDTASHSFIFKTLMDAAMHGTHNATTTIFDGSAIANTTTETTITQVITVPTAAVTPGKTYIVFVHILHDVASSGAQTTALRLYYGGQCICSSGNNEAPDGDLTTKTNRSLMGIWVFTFRSAGTSVNYECLEFLLENFIDQSNYAVAGERVGSMFITNNHNAGGAAPVAVATINTTGFYAGTSGKPLEVTFKWGVAEATATAKCVMYSVWEVN